MFELPFLSVKFRGMNSAPWKADWRGALLPKTTKWAGFIITRAFAEVCRELSRYMIKRHLSQLVHSRFGVGHCCTPVATAQVADQQKSSTVDQCLRKGRFFTVIQVNKVCATDISLSLSFSLSLSLSLSRTFALKVLTKPFYFQPTQLRQLSQSRQSRSRTFSLTRTLSFALFTNV